MTQKFLVTGGLGFIGRYLCRELLASGHEVRVLDSLVPQVHGDRPAPPPDGIEFIRDDVRNEQAVRRALEGVHGVFHLAAEVGVGQSMYEVERYVSANDVGTAVLLQELIQRPVHRIVVASSMSVYGEGRYTDSSGRPRAPKPRLSADLKEGRWDPRGPSDEALLPVPTAEDKTPELASIYALTKYVQERAVLIFGQAYPVEAVALRLFNVFGAGQALSNPYTGVLANFSSRLTHGRRPLVFEDGQQRRDFVHVRDVARAFRLAMERPEAAGHVLNVGSGDATWFRLKGRKITDRTFPIAHRANRWAVSPSGRWATAWSAEEPDERLDPTEGLQDITVVDLGVEPPVTHRLTVGYRPSALSYSAGEEELIVVSEAGISLVDLWGSSPVSTGWIDLGSASGRGVAVTPSGEYALVRRAGEPVVSILPLDGSPPAEVQLGGAVTDLELDAEGRRAVAVVREKRQIAVFDVEAAFADPAKVDVATVPGEIFGSVALSPDGDVAALYTTALDSGRVVIADLRAGDTYLETRTVDVKGPVLSVRTTTGGDHAVVLMGKGAQSTNPGSFAVVSLREPRFPRVEATAAPVHQVAVSADYALVTTRDGAAGIFESHLIEMASGRLDKVRLSSPPTAVGILGEQGLGYVAQSHPEGRVTVLNFASATARTLTGFELASKVVE